MNKTGLKLGGLKFGVLLFLLSCFTVATNAQSVEEGQKLFEANCVSCHAVHEKLVGSALKDMHKRRQKDWLVKWIKNSSAMIKAGDPIAVQLYNENNQAVMNSFENLSDAQITSIIDYIGVESDKGPAAAVPPTDNGGVVTPDGPTPVASDPGTTKSINLVLIGIAILAIFISIAIFKILQLLYSYAGVKFVSWQKINAWLMIIFLVAGMSAAIWETFAHGKYILIDNAASEHGPNVDFMMIVTLIIIGIVFVVTQIALFWFAFKYQKSDTRKATFYPHNNTLEIVWTVIPAIVLTILVLNGFNFWRKITSKAPDEAMAIEVFAYQFGWSARYPGADGKLGNSNFNMISNSNPLGVLVKDKYDNQLVEIQAELNEADSVRKIMANIPDPTEEELEKMSELDHRIKIRTTQLSRLKSIGTNPENFSPVALDDVVTNEIHIPLGKPVLLQFRARDVIHSAYLPHFRMQMNCVPGMPTQFWFTPTISTNDMRGRLKDPKFDYYLFCAKICGAAHFNMKIKVVVESEAEYQAWLATQKPSFSAQPALETAPAVDSTAADAKDKIVMK